MCVCHGPGGPGGPMPGKFEYSKFSQDLDLAPTRGLEDVISMTPKDMALASRLVTGTYNELLQTAASLEDQGYRRLMTECISSPKVTFLELYPSQDDRRKLFDVDPVGIVNSPSAVAGRHQPGAEFFEKSRGVASHVSKALNGHPGAFQGKVAERSRHLGALGDSVAGGADFVERDAAQHSRQTHGPADFVFDPSHARFVGSHVGAGNVTRKIANPARKGANEPRLVGGFGVGNDARFTSAVPQTGCGILQGHGARQAKHLFGRNIGRHAHPADGRPARRIIDDHDPAHSARRIV